MRNFSPTLAILAGLLAVLPVRACNVPVFRYALEHWSAEPYRVTLYHRGPLSGADLARIDALEQASPTRVQFHSIDLATESCDDPPAQLPWLIANYPASARISAPLWQGKLDDGTIDALLDSPRRSELVARLLAGDTAVWLLLESGQPAVDDAVAARVTAQSRRIEATLKLPVLTHSVEDRIRDDVVPLRLSFSLLRVSRTDPAERMLVRMLLGSEPDLEQISGPLLFPVFGRGRALYALAGAGINDVNLLKAADFLLAACSCKVKEAHPGVDLLLSAQWPTAPDETSISASGEPVAVPLPAGKPKLPISPAIAQEVGAANGSRVWLLVGIFAAALFVVVTGRRVWRV